MLTEQNAVVQLTQSEAHRSSPAVSQSLHSTYVDTGSGFYPPKSSQNWVQLPPNFELKFTPIFSNSTFPSPRPLGLLPLSMGKFR